MSSRATAGSRATTAVTGASPRSAACQARGIAGSTGRTVRHPGTATVERSTPTRATGRRRAAGLLILPFPLRLITEDARAAVLDDAATGRGGPVLSLRLRGTLRMRFGEPLQPTT